MCLKQRMLDQDFGGTLFLCSSSMTSEMSWMAGAIVFRKSLWITFVGSFPPNVCICVLVESFQAVYLQYMADQVSIKI